MLGNFHTHTTFCDGKNTPEEIILAAIDKGFTAIGFSGHGYTEFDLRYCMKDTAGYVQEIRRLQEKYKNKIQVYLGIEEDAFQPADRSQFDYIIGSSHYFHVNNAYLPIDSNYDYFKKCLEAFHYDIPLLAEMYYSNFVHYIQTRKPDIIGHFDLITKFDELDTSLFLQNDAYNKIAEKYVSSACESPCIFEFNTGAIARGLRTSGYPGENLLRILQKHGGRIILASDSHSADTLDYGFSEAKAFLKNIGFTQLYTLYNHEFISYNI